MLGLIEIKSETPKGVNQTGGFLSIKFKAENEKDVDLLMDIFGNYLNLTFCGLADRKYNEDDEGVVVTLNKKQTLNYDYQKDCVNIY